MARINVKLDEVESGFQTYPEDKYLVEILDKTRIATSQANEPKIIWISKIIEGDFEGKLFSWDTSLTTAALWNVKSLLEAMGFEWDEDGFDTEDCVGSQVVINVVIEPWEGEDRNKVKGYLKP